MSTRLYVEFTSNKVVDQFLGQSEGTYDAYLKFMKDFPLRSYLPRKQKEEIRERLRKHDGFCKFAAEYVAKYAESMHEVENGKLTDYGLEAALYSYTVKAFGRSSAWESFGFGKCIDTEIYDICGSRTDKEEIKELMFHAVHDNLEVRKLSEYFDEIVNLHWC